MDHIIGKLAANHRRSIDVLCGLDERTAMAISVSCFLRENWPVSCGRRVDHLFVIINLGGTMRSSGRQFEDRARITGIA